MSAVPLAFLLLAALVHRGNARGDIEQIQFGWWYGLVFSWIPRLVENGGCVKVWMCAGPGYLPVSWLAGPVPTTLQLPPLWGASSNKRVGVGDAVGVTVAAGIAQVLLR